MTHIRKNQGVCSHATQITLSPGGIIEEVKVMDGCNGNLQGLCLLLRGMTAEDAMARLKGIQCDDRPTSCPDQISLCIKEALEKQ